MINYNSLVTHSTQQILNDILVKIWTLPEEDKPFVLLLNIDFEGAQAKLLLSPALDYYYQIIELPFVSEFLSMSVLQLTNFRFKNFFIFFLRLLFNKSIFTAFES